MGLGLEDVGHHGGRVVRAFASERGGGAVGGGADEALADEYAHARVLERGLQARLRSLYVDVCVLVALVGDEGGAHVNPAVVDTRVFEVLRYDGGRYQLAEGDDGVVPQLGVGGAVGGVGDDGAQLREEVVNLRYAYGCTPQVGDDRVVVLDNAFYLVEALLFSLVLHVGEDRLQSVGGLAHGRNDNEQIVFSVDDVSQIPYAVGILDRGSSELVDLHGRIHLLLLCK